MQVAAPSRPARARLFAGGVAAVAGATIALAGCGGSAQAGGGAGDVAAFIPAGAPAYVEASTDLSGDQWRQALVVAKRFPGYGDAVRSVTRELSSMSVDFETDVKPLLGDAVGVGVYDFPARSAKGPRESFVAAVDLAHGKGPDLVALIQRGSSPAKKVGTHDGVDLYGDADATVAVVDDTAVIGSSKDLVTRSLDAHAAGGAQTMAGSKRLDEAFAQLPDEVLAKGFVDVGEVARLADRTRQGGLAKQLADAGVGADAALGASVSAEQAGLRVKAVGLGFGAAADEVQQFTPTLVNHVPADAIAYAGVSNSFGIAQRAIEQLSGSGQEAKDEIAKAALALPLLGVTRDDIAGLTSKEHALVVTKGAATPGVVAALQVEDPAKATATLDALRKNAPALLKSMGRTIPPFTPVDLANGVRGWQSQVSPKAGVVYGVDGNLVVVGTTPGAVKQVQSPSTSLADDPAYQAATSEMPSKVGGVLWVNGEELYRALDGAGALKDVPKDAVANLRSIKSLAAWSTVSGGTPMFEALATIR